MWTDFNNNTFTVAFTDELQQKAGIKSHPLSNVWSHQHHHLAKFECSTVEVYNEVIRVILKIKVASALWTTVYIH